jgi:Protein of unknown function (DUF4231)
MDEQAWKDKSAKILTDIKVWREAHPEATFVEIKAEVHKQMLQLETQVRQDTTQAFPPPDEQAEDTRFWVIRKIWPLDLNSVTSDNILKTLNNVIDEHYGNNGYITGRFKDAVWYFETSEDTNNGFYTFLKFAIVILSAFTTFVVGLEAILATSIALKIIALFLALCVTILSTFLTTFGFQAKSAAYRRYRETLITEFYEFHKHIEDYKCEEEVDEEGKKRKREDLFVIRVEGIIGDANKATEGFQMGKGN